MVSGVTIVTRVGKASLGRQILVHLTSVSGPSGSSIHSRAQPQTSSLPYKEHHFKVNQMVMNLAAGRRPGFYPLIQTIPWRMEQLPTPVFLPGEFHGQRSLVGCGP